MKFHIPQDSIMTRRLPTEEMRFLRLVVVFDLRFHASQSLPITPLQHEILLTSFHLSVYFFYHSPLLSIQSLSANLQPSPSIIRDWFHHVQEMKKHGFAETWKRDFHRSVPIPLSWKDFSWKADSSAESRFSFGSARTNERGKDIVAREKQTFYDRLITGDFKSRSF